MTVHWPDHHLLHSDKVQRIFITEKFAQQSCSFLLILKKNTIFLNVIIFFFFFSLSVGDLFGDQWSQWIERLGEYFILLVWGHYCSRLCYYDMILFQKVFIEVLWNLPLFVSGNQEKEPPISLWGLELHHLYEATTAIIAVMKQLMKNASAVQKFKLRFMQTASASDSLSVTLQLTHNVCIYNALCGQ